MTVYPNRLFWMLGLAALFTGGEAAFAQDCTKQLDTVEQTLEESDMSGDQIDGLRGDLETARGYASDGKNDLCLAAAANLQVSLLQIDGIDHSLLCDRTKGEAEVGEADMAGTEDVKSALQTGCSAR